MSDQRTVLVTGATGNVGRHIVATLAAAGHPVRAASRHRPIDPAAATSHVPFDWHDPATHQPAVDGVHAVYLMPPPASADPVGQVGAFLDLAQDAGVRRIVLLSSSAIRTGDPGPGQLHAKIVDRFPEWTVLRPSWFMQNFGGGGCRVLVGVLTGGVRRRSSFSTRARMAWQSGQARPVGTRR
ncbi:NAD(P)H-binding protein [Micromonospora sp. LOL_015]|uniref:NAD(P)H-binding protein n=1 Tax=Micromonospora sp. LOL_015 TaxID=3345416 RepID=UPI003A879E21